MPISLGCNENIIARCLKMRSNQILRVGIEREQKDSCRNFIYSTVKRSARFLFLPCFAKTNPRFHLLDYHRRLARGRITAPAPPPTHVRRDLSIRTIGKWRGVTWPFICSGQGLTILIWIMTKLKCCLTLFGNEASLSRALTSFETRHFFFCVFRPFMHPVT